MSELNHPSSIDRAVNATEFTSGDQLDLHAANVELSYEELRQSERLTDEALNGVDTQQIINEVQRPVELLPHQRLGQIGLNLQSVRSHVVASGVTLQQLTSIRSDAHHSR